MIYYGDLLRARYRPGGRGNGYDCYGLVIECCNRAQTPIPDLKVFSTCDTGKYIQDAGVKKSEGIAPGKIVELKMEGRAHIGYVVEEGILHMTRGGAKLTPVDGLDIIQIYEVKK
jgi:hypothetical protein